MMGRGGRHSGGNGAVKCMVLGASELGLEDEEAYEEESIGAEYVCEYYPVKRSA